jgi:hypothetical protein
MYGVLANAVTVRAKVRLRTEAIIFILLTRELLCVGRNSPISEARAS